MAGTTERRSEMKRILKAIALIGSTRVSAQVVAHGSEGQAHGAAAKSAAGAEQTAFGRAGEPSKVTRSVAVSMSDQMRYDPAVIRVKTGATIKFLLANHGQGAHEFVLGTLQEIQEHAALMKKFPGMEHDEPSQARVKPGGKEELVWQFNKPGEFYFACLMPGHYEAGMVGKVIVASK